MNPSRHATLFSGFVLAAVLLVSETLTPAQNASEKAAPRLSPEVIAKLSEAQELQGRQRFVDALAKLDEVEAIAPDLTELHNLRGSIFLSPSLRDFDKAEFHFNRAKELDPNGIGPRFNLAELLFVKHDFKAALEAFEQILKDYPKIPLGIRHLILFKSLICDVKLDKAAEAEAIITDHFTFMDDTPAYYYSKAALAFQADKEDEGKAWIARAESIFKPQENAAYNDTMMEVRWVMNIGLPPVKKDGQ